MVNARRSGEGMQNGPADAWRTMPGVQVPLGQQNGAGRAAGQAVPRYKVPSGVQHGHQACRAVGCSAMSGRAQDGRRPGRAVLGRHVLLGS